jgi:hypothetical protein
LYEESGERKLNVKVHSRIGERHPEINSDDVLFAWRNSLRSMPRVRKNPREYVAVGVDGRGRIIEMVAARMRDGSWVIFHALTPPTKRTLKELRFNEGGRR